MIHTLEAVSLSYTGDVFSFASIVKAAASLRKYATWCPDRPYYWLQFPDRQLALAVMLRKRPRADVELERARATWARLRSQYGEQLAGYTLGGLCDESDRRAIEPHWTEAHNASLFEFNDALRRPRETPDEIVKRLGLDATFFNSAYARRIGLDTSRPRETPDEMVKSLGLDCPWAGELTATQMDSKACSACKQSRPCDCQMNGGAFKD